jgi:hypothetical protein
VPTIAKAMSCSTAATNTTAADLARTESPHSAGPTKKLPAAAPTPAHSGFSADCEEAPSAITEAARARYRTPGGYTNNDSR